MRAKIDTEKELVIKIEMVRELLHKQMEEKLERKEIQKISEEFDKLIIDYLGK